MNDDILITRESYEKLVNELEYLTTTVRMDIAKNLKIAADYGDLRENSEFEAEKDRQNVVESRIRDIQRVLNTCKVIDLDKTDEKKVTIGKNVILFDFESNEEIEFKITDSVESNVLEGKLSYISPVGKAILEKKVDDVVIIELNKEIIKYKILDIK